MSHSPQNFRSDDISCRESDKFKTRFASQLTYQRSLPSFLSQERFMSAIYSEHPGALGSVARALLERYAVPARHGLRIAVDRDPISLL